MSQVVLKVDASSLDFRGKLPTADIWLDVGGYAFPQPKWNDFAVVILGWWAESMVRMLCGRSDVEELRFMDGPYAVLVCRGREEGNLDFAAREGVGRSKVAAVGVAGISSFAQELLAQGASIAAQCRKRAHISQDLRDLESRLAELREALYSS